LAGTYRITYTFNNVSLEDCNTGVCGGNTASLDIVITGGGGGGGGGGKPPGAGE